jgi:hypothetical protein
MVLAFVAGVVIGPVQTAEWPLGVGTEEAWCAAQAPMPNGFTFTVPPLKMGNTPVRWWCKRMHRNRRFPRDRE